MPRLRFNLIGALAVAAALAACGSPPAASSTTPVPTPPSTARPTPTPTPPPDTLRVDVASNGFGVYQAVVIPVAVLHNVATRTTITGVVAHFVPSRGGRPLPALDSPAVTLHPGETLAVTADCTDGCNNTGTVSGPDALAVTVVGGSWAVVPGTPIVASGGTLTCRNGCGGGHGQWDVSATLGNAQLAQGTRVDLFTWCTNAAGAIVGGNPPSVVQWPQAGGTLTLTLHAIVSVTPAACLVGASAAS
jgi:hypothetical protein